MPDVFANLLLLESNCRDRIAARPQLFTVEVALPAPKLASQLQSRFFP